MLGSSFQDVASRDYKIIPTHHQNPDKDTIPLDVTNQKDVKDKICHLHPDVVITSAALSNVNYICCPYQCKLLRKYPTEVWPECSWNQKKHNPNL